RSASTRADSTAASTTPMPVGKGAACGRTTARTSCGTSRAGRGRKANWYTSRFGPIRWHAESGELRVRKDEWLMATRRREVLATLGAGLLATRFARAQTAASPASSPLPVRKVKTTVLFKSPEGYPNALALAPEGLWIA